MTTARLLRPIAGIKFLVITITGALICACEAANPNHPNSETVTLPQFMASGDPQLFLQVNQPLIINPTLETQTWYRVSLRKNTQSIATFTYYNEQIQHKLLFGAAGDYNAEISSSAQTGAPNIMKMPLMIRVTQQETN